MIVLDEQLLGYHLDTLIARWYKGPVVSLPRLRPASHIFDDAVPELLRTVRNPCFVTINVDDFWRRMAPDPHFGILCFALSHLRAREISPLLRRLFRLQPFRSRRARLGKVVPR
jgi:hypothetical protein